MELSIIIVNFNVKHFLEQCLHAVYKALGNIPAEVFVVDNHSVDGSAELIQSKFPEVKLILNQKNVGFSAANNQAIKLANGQYILLLNPDTVVQEDTFVKALGFMNNHPDAGGLGIKMLDGKGRFLPESKRGLPTPAVAFYKIFGLAKLFPHSKRFGQYHLSYLDKDQNHQVDILSGAFMLMRKTALDKSGLLDETFFMYGEDIDLSYRLTLAGYKNYYFAESSIIHYKGESTKKSSVNYVVVFYKAMAIFARKHFSSRNAGLFSLLIHLAIYLRATLAILARLIKQLALPVLDFGIILIGLFALKSIYQNYRELYPNFYSAEILKLFFPLYTLSWMWFVYMNGGYDKPIKLRNIIRGVITGSATILIVYSLLPEHYRFSRALILLGSIYTLVVYLLTRTAFHLAGVKGMQMGHRAERIAIVGSVEEYTRVSALLKETKINTEYIGFISTNHQSTHPEAIGDFSRAEEIIKLHHINEVIFCAKDVSSQDIIHKMTTLAAMGLEYKIAPPESLSVIGSSSIDTAGELYVIDLNNVGRPANKRTKRLLDVLIALMIILLLPIIVVLQKNKITFIRNLFQVLIGYKTWVGYGKANLRELPDIKPSVLTPAIMLTGPVDVHKNNKALLNYARDYQPENDLKIMLKGYNLLGN